ncbi:hypothetical protein EHW99_0770 [Erwinia amylovora]|nr:hypothetical protein EHX00_0770 [Erwinia amylovora]QJQ57175.1 hypothetical protein EHW99_0770 [Erwinia amylovora]QJQ60874.1 hypothetical protein EHW98_0770 [Erwinia amylovora]QJQ64676.1 hypothetical protein EHW96_0770 [Erwinia amylovora]QJQ68375.1 hypothetical protein EGZ89_0770 [Erwinia amylovora]
MYHAARFNPEKRPRKRQGRLTPCLIRVTSTLKASGRLLNSNDNQQTDVPYLQHQQDCSRRYH